MSNDQSQPNRVRDNNRGILILAVLIFIALVLWVFTAA